MKPRLLFVMLLMVALISGLLLTYMGHPPFSDRPLRPEVGEPVAEETGEPEVNAMTITVDHPVTLEISLSEQLRSTMREAATSELSLTSISLLLQKFTPDEAGADAVMGVYLDLPEGESTSVDSPHYVGSVAFSHQDSTSPHADSFYLSLTGALRKLHQSGKLDLEKGYIKLTITGRLIDDQDSRAFSIVAGDVALEVVH